MKRRNRSPNATYVLPAPNILLYISTDVNPFPCVLMRCTFYVPPASAWRDLNVTKSGFDHAIRDIKRNAHTVPAR